MRRARSNRKTTDFEGLKYSPELIRQLEDPEYAKKAAAYEREALRGKHSRQGNSGRNNGKDKKTKKYKLNKGTFIKNILKLLLLLIVVGIGAFFLLTRTFDFVDADKSEFAIASSVEDDLSGYRNIAILGSDARSDEGYEGSRTDAIIIMSIKKTTGEVRLISVMRDSYLKMEYSDGSMILDKITHANHWVDGGNTCGALNRSLDLNIDEYILFNWEAVSDMVDCLGGIEINVKENEINDLNKWGHETAVNVGGTYNKITETGTQTLDGVQAVTYCRIRKTSGGDSGRGQRYKKVMNAVIKKAMVHPLKLIELSNSVLPYIRTNMSQLQLFTLCAGFPRYDIKKSISWPYDYYSGPLSDGLDYVVPTTLESNVEKLHRKAFNQENYNLSDTCLQINQDIIYDTGIQ